MRNITLPDMEVQLTPEEAGMLRRQVIAHLANIKNEWFNKQLRKIVPPEIYKQAYDESGSNDEFIWRKERLKKWLDGHDIRIEEKGIHGRIFQGSKLIHTLVVKLADE